MNFPDISRYQLLDTIYQLGEDSPATVVSRAPDAQIYCSGSFMQAVLCGNGWGGFAAEYVCAKESTLALKPTNLTFTQAAAVPQRALNPGGIYVTVAGSVARLLQLLIAARGIKKEPLAS